MSLLLVFLKNFYARHFCSDTLTVISGQYSLQTEKKNSQLLFLGRPTFPEWSLKSKPHISQTAL